MPTPDAAATWWLPTLTLWRREMVRFVRERQRVVSALMTPLLFWLFLGLGLNHMMAPVARDGKEFSYLQYLYPGMVVFMLLSTAVFSTITVIEDRREGFLQGVLTSPAPRAAIVLGKVLGGATIAGAQGLLLLCLWPAVLALSGGHVGSWGQVVSHVLAAGGAMLVLALELTTLGLCIAWPMNSTSGFHAVMMVFLMPMWFLCGAVFPATGAPLWLRVVMGANPLSYGQAAVSGLLTGQPGLTGAPLPAGGALAVTVGVTLLLLLAATALVQRPRADGLA